MCKMYNKHEEEGKRGHVKWGRRKRKTFVIRAERYSNCRRMRVVPVVLDEVLLSCWATKLFIYKTLAADGHGGKDRSSPRPHHQSVDGATQSGGFYQRHKLQNCNLVLLQHFKAIKPKCHIQHLSFTCWPLKKVSAWPVRSPLRSKVNCTVWIHNITGCSDHSDIINNRQAVEWGCHCFVTVAYYILLKMPLISRSHVSLMIERLRGLFLG